MPLGVSRGYSHKVLLAALQQAAVCMDLLLQAALDVQQDPVLVVLALHVAAQLAQLLLHAGDQPLQLGQLGAVAVLCVGQGALQRRFLCVEEKDGVRGGQG